MKKILPAFMFVVFVFLYGCSDEEEQVNYPDVVVSVSYPTNGQYIPSSNLTVYGTAGGGNGITRVMVRVDSGSWKTASGTLNWTNSFTSLVDGSHKLYAYSVDRDGRESDVKSLSFVVDTVSPSVNVLSPSSNTNIRNLGVTISGTAEDDKLLANVYLRMDGGSWQVASGTTNWSFTFELVEAGEHQVDVYSADMGGLTSPVESLTLSVQPVLIGTSSSTDEARAVVFDDSGSVIVATCLGTNKVAFVKYNPDGNSVWKKVWSYSSLEKVNDLAVDYLGNIYAVGETLTGAGGGDILLLKLSKDGDLIFSKAFGGTALDEADSVVVGRDGSIYVAGYTESFGTGGDVLVAKFDSSGNLLWSSTWGGTSEDKGFDLDVYSDTLIVVGYSASGGAGGKDVVVLSYTTNGTLDWQKLYGGANDDVGKSVSVESEIQIAGLTYSYGSGGSDVLFLKCALSNGDVSMQKVWGGASDDVANTMVVNPIGSTYVAGYTKSFNGSSVEDILVMKYDLSGNLIWSKVWQSGENKKVLSMSMSGMSGKVLVSGVSGSSNVSLTNVNGSSSTPSLNVVDASGTTNSPSLTGTDVPGNLSDFSGTGGDGADGFVMAVE